jgi:hypothetical protein
MFCWMKKLYRLIIASNTKQTPEQSSSKKKDDPLSGDLKVNLKKIKETFANASDIVIRQFEIGSDVRIDAFIVYVDGLVDKEIVQISLMKPLMIDMHLAKTDDFF